MPTHPLARWQETRHDRYVISRAEAEIARELPRPVALAEDYLVGALSAPGASVQWLRLGSVAASRPGGSDAAPVASDDATLRAAIVAHLADLPDLPDATRPYRDLRAVALDTSTGRGAKARAAYFDAVAVAVRGRLPAYREPRPPRGPAYSHTSYMRGWRADRKAAERATAEHALTVYLHGVPKHTPEQRSAHIDALPDRVTPRDLHDWVSRLVDLWRDRYDTIPDLDDWPALAAQLGAPAEPAPAVGPRVLLGVARDALPERVIRGTRYLMVAEYERRPDPALAALRDALAAVAAGGDAERAAAAAEALAELDLPMPTEEEARRAS